MAGQGDPELGFRIAHAREEINMTQAEFASEIGLATAQSVSNYERGVTEVPAKRLRRISEVTGKTVGWLLGTEDEPEPEPEASQLDRLELLLGRVELFLQHVEEIERRIPAATRRASSPDRSAPAGERLRRQHLKS